MKRREFIIGSSALMASNVFGQDGIKAKYRVGVIGHTGRGNYGHGLDKVWLSVPQAEIAGVADPVEKGLASAQKRLKTDKGFSDYKKMLEAVKPDIVAVAPRHVDQHFDMLSAAINFGAKGIYVEKPFVRSPEEADKILKLAKSANCKIAVAHRNRYHPVLHTVKKLISEGAIGKVLEYRGRGVGDKRGGCVDLWVLGSHIFNLMQFFGGKARTCSSMIMQDNEVADLKNLREGEEGLGKIVGNRLHARYVLENGAIADYNTIAEDGTNRKGYVLEIIGSGGIFKFHIDRNPLVTVMLGNPYESALTQYKTYTVSSAGIDKPEPIHDLHKNIANHVTPAIDLIDSVEKNKEPICNGEEGAQTVEMICAVFASHKNGGASVKLPLESRAHPFGI